MVAGHQCVNVDQHDAAVACKQLGHSIYSCNTQCHLILLDMTLISHVAVFTTGYGSSQSAITSLTCQSSYNHFNQCTINAYSTCSTSTTFSLPSCSRAIRCTRKIRILILTCRCKIISTVLQHTQLKHVLKGLFA